MQQAKKGIGDAEMVQRMRRRLEVQAILGLQEVAQERVRITCSGRIREILDALIPSRSRFRSVRLPIFREIE
jgi:hypothetical protein